MQAIEKSAKMLSLDWFTIILHKIISKTSETRQSLDNYDINYLLSLYEAVNFDEHVDILLRKDANSQKQDMQKPVRRRFR